MKESRATFRIKPELRFIAYRPYFLWRRGLDEPEPKGMFVFEVQVGLYIPAPGHTFEYSEPSSIPELQVVLINGFRSA
jgi:hypothetical protein